MKVMWKYVKWTGIVLILIIVGLIAISELTMCSYKNSVYAYGKIDSIPKFKTGLLLGTAKYVTRGVENHYYKYRLQAAYQLWRKGKIKHILISGDNSSPYYNEPITIKKDLIEMGIADSIIYLDYAGFRTFDSVVRAGKVFGQDSFLIISQEFHNLRALFIADKNGLYARAYNARSVSGDIDIKTKIRERLARVKALLDVYILSTDPKYLGKPVKID